MGFISMEGHMSDSKTCTTHGGCILILSFANSNCDSRLDSGHPKMSMPWSLEPVTVLFPMAKRICRWDCHGKSVPDYPGEFNVIMRALIRERQESQREGGAEKGRRVCFVDGRRDRLLRKASGSWKGNGFSLRASKGNKALLTHWF